MSRRGGHLFEGGSLLSSKSVGVYSKKYGIHYACIYKRKFRDCKNDKLNLSRSVNCHLRSWKLSCAGRHVDDCTTFPGHDTSTKLGTERENN